MSRSLYKYLSRQGLLRFLDRLTLRFTPPFAFNDPLEALPALVPGASPRDAALHGDRGTADILHAALLRSFAGRVGILCLAEDPLNLLMWGHYASAHQGGVVEFDADHPFFAASTTPGGLFQSLRQVLYMNRRPELPFEYFRQHRMFFLNDHGDGWLDLLTTGHDLLFTKSLDWSYEREWRLVRQLVEPRDGHTEERAGMFEGPHLAEEYLANPVPAGVEIATVPIASVKAVFLGARSYAYNGPLPPYEEQAWALLAAKAGCGHVSVQQAVIHPDEFRLVSFDLQDGDAVRANMPATEYAARQSRMHGVPFRQASPRAPDPT